MFYDLNVPWPTAARDQQQLPRTLHFLHELGYSVVALNHTITGKLPADLTSPIPSPLPFAATLPPGLEIKTRVTVVLTEAGATASNARLAELSRRYDLLALRPGDERGLALACSSLDCDVVSLDLAPRLPFWFRHKMLGEAVAAGKKLEICYAQAMTGAAGASSTGGGGGGGAPGPDAARRNLISNATQLIRASRGRGLLLSSEARAAVACRGPWDVVNLAAVWGLPQERAVEALSKEARSVLVGAALKRTSYRGVVDIVYGGEKPQEGTQKVVEKGRAGTVGAKRKAEAVDEQRADGSADDNGGAQPMSKRQMKRQQKEARSKAAADTAAVEESGTGARKA